MLPLCVVCMQVFLYISNDKKVMGCVFAEKISLVQLHVNVQSTCTILIEYRFIAMRHIFNSLLSEHKHSKQNDDYSTFRPESLLQPYIHNLQLPTQKVK